jgi:hypothetical protein
MYINRENFLAELDFAVGELRYILAELQGIAQDIPGTHDRLQDLNGIFVHGSRHMVEIIEFIAQEKPDPDVVGTRLKDYLNLMTSILTEKTRIIKDTPSVIYNTNDLTSPN